MHANHVVRAMQFILIAMAKLKHDSRESFVAVLLVWNA